MKISRVILGDMEQVEIKCVADLHIGSDKCDYVMISEMVKWVQAKKNRYIVIAGDIFNTALPSSVSASPNESWDMDAMLERGTAILQPISKKIIGMVRGNHDKRVLKLTGIDLTRHLCFRLDVKYFETEAALAIQLGKHGGNAKRGNVTYLMYMTHGIGGGSTDGGNANALTRSGKAIVADIFVQGHTHRPLAIKNAIYKPNSQYTSIEKHEQLYIRTGGALGRESYVAELGLAPSVMTWPVILLNGRAKEMNVVL